MSESLGVLSNVENIASRAVFSETLKSCLGGWVSFCGPPRTTKGEDVALSLCPQTSVSQPHGPKAVREGLGSSRSALLGE